MTGDDLFDDLFFTHAARLVRLVRLLGDDDPEDVVQEAFCKLYAARRRLRSDQAEVVAYLNRIAINEVRSRHRRRTVARRDTPLLATRDVDDDHTLRHNDRQVVLSALAALPNRQREALVLRYWMDLPLAGVAEAMRVRLGTAKSQVSRGLQALAVQLDETEVRR